MFAILFLDDAIGAGGVHKQVIRRKKPQIEEDFIATDECPEPDGYFADAEQCDKYYACRDGQFTAKLCPDGMVFNDYSSQEEKCDLPFNIDCSSRPNLRKFFTRFLFV